MEYGRNGTIKWALWKVKVNRQAYPQVDEDYLKATKQEHKVEQCNMTKIVVYDDMDEVAKISV